MTHEDFSRQEDIKPSSDRSFGLVIAAFFLIVAFWPLIHAEPVRWWALGVAAVFARSGAAVDGGARSAQQAVDSSSVFSSIQVVNPVVLGLLFYVTVTPIALLMRVLGKDPLRLRRDPDATSYWIERTPPGPTPESMKNQF